VLLALGSHAHDPLAAAFVVRSHDLGRTWRPPIEVARADSLVLSEPSITRTQSGKLLVMSRDETSGHTFQSESLDDGRTWSLPHPLDFWGYPAHCIPTSDGRLLIVYGRRRPPYGIRAAISDDDGVSWHPEITVRDDFPNDNLGYPSVIEYAPRRFFTAYYGEDDSGVTCIQGTYFAA
jgi:sialidase-1